eukprot:scaffold265599_cov45-Prasinocladus_malaysianus.AAC.1
MSAQRASAGSLNQATFSGRLLGILLLLTSFLAQVSGTAPLAGGGGFARYFRGLAGSAADIASVKMALPPMESTTEFWVSAWTAFCVPRRFCTYSYRAQTVKKKRAETLTVSLCPYCISKRSTDAHTACSISEVKSMK